MKLVRVPATDQDSRRSDKNRNTMHYYTIESKIMNDKKIIEMEKVLSSKFPSDGNCYPEDGHTSTFYINIEQVEEFKKTYKELKKTISN